MSESRGRPLPFHTFCAQTAHPYIHTSALCAITTNTLCCLLAVRRPHSEGTKVVDSAVLRFPKAVTHFSPGVRAWVHICQAICSEHSLFTRMPEYIKLTPCLTLPSFWGYMCCTAELPASPLPGDQYPQPVSGGGLGQGCPPRCQRAQSGEGIRHG